VVGAFVIVLIGALIGAALWLASGGTLQKKFDLYGAVERESVAGLNVNAPVKYNGVEVGKVKQIQLDKLNPELVQLLFAIERGTPIKVDTVATLKIQGLTGIAYVELSGGAANAAPLMVSEGSLYPMIRTKPSLSARLENVLATVLSKLDSTARNVDAILSVENQVAFKSALTDISAVAHTLASRKQSIDSSLANAEKALNSISKMSSQVAPNVGPILERISKSAQAIQDMSAELGKTSASATLTVDSVGADVRRFSAETLPELSRLLNDLTTLSNSMRRLSDQTERDPRSLIFGRKEVPSGPGETLKDLP
jgi:phospholipid/cholesterol/gamma-HCH transport system substrate-binding protein